MLGNSGRNLSCILCSWKHHAGTSGMNRIQNYNSLKKINHFSKMTSWFQRRKTKTPGYTSRGWGKTRHLLPDCTVKIVHSSRSDTWWSLTTAVSVEVNKSLWPHPICSLMTCIGKWYSYPHDDMDKLYRESDIIILMMIWTNCIGEVIWLASWWSGQTL